jgi:hypothetical protein
MLTIFGIGALIVFPIQVYRTAKNTGRSAGMWAAITAVLGVAIQFGLPMFIGIALAIYLMAAGSDIDDNFATSYSGLFNVIGVVSIGLSIVGMWLVFKYVAKVPDEEVSLYPKPPPPPPTFDQ